VAWVPLSSDMLFARREREEIKNKAGGEIHCSPRARAVCDLSTRATASGRGPSLGIGSRAKGGLRGVALSGA